MFRNCRTHIPFSIEGSKNGRLMRIILIITFVFGVGQLVFNAATLDTWLDEGNYLMKGYWYVSNQVTPYSEIDPTGYMPLFFYLVGWVQEIFGIGYAPGRALTVFFATGCLILVYLIGFKLGRTPIAGIGALILLVGHHVSLTYFATATPYAFVSFLSLLLVFILLTVESRRLAFGMSGLILYALIFTRPNMLPIAMIPAGWILLIEPRGKLECLVLAFLAFCAPAICTMLWFGDGLTDVVLTVPGVSHLANLIGIQPPPISEVISLTTSPLDPIVPLKKIAGYFGTYFLKPYALLTVVTLTFIVIRVTQARKYPNKRIVKPIDILITYFWVTTLLHYMLSLSYCINCIIPYTNYFLPIGTLAVAGLIGEFVGLGRKQYTALAVLGLISVFAVVMQINPTFPTLLRPQNEQVRETATALAEQLQPVVRKGEQIVVISPNVAVSQAIWLTGGTVETRSIYLPISYRQPMANLDESDIARADKSMWRAGFWFDDNMRRAIETEYQTLLVERRQTYDEPLLHSVRNGLPFGDLVEKHYQLTAEIKLGEHVFMLYRRKI